VQQTRHQPHLHRPGHPGHQPQQTQPAHHYTTPQPAASLLRHLLSDSFSTRI